MEYGWRKNLLWWKTLGKTDVWFLRAAGGTVEKEKLLFAREDKYVNNEVEGEKVAEGILINSECLHWKYMFDLKEVINESGVYCVSITVHQDGKSAFLINSLSVENKEYIFAKDSMEKDY